ncbi:hypothetical protein LCGC14_1685610, partial [marine sediment metagenome]
MKGIRAASASDRQAVSVSFSVSLIPIAVSRT